MSCYDKTYEAKKNLKLLDTFYKRRSKYTQPTILVVNVKDRLTQAPKQNGDNNVHARTHTDE